MSSLVQRAIGENQSTTETPVAYFLCPEPTRARIHRVEEWLYTEQPRTGDFKCMRDAAQELDACLRRIEEYRLEPRHTEALFNM